MSSQNGIYDLYFNHTRELCQTYGKRSIVFMQVGGFIEIYGKKNVKTGEIYGSEIMDFKAICDFNMSEKSNSIKNNEVVVMAGFPDYNLDKYLDKLVEHSYTVAVYSQDKNEKKHYTKFRCDCITRYTFLK